MRVVLLIAAAALVSCSPPAERPADAPPSAPPAAVVCNDLAPDYAHMVSVSDPVATPALADLSGGRITPGTYDLVRATRINNATGWAGEQAVALRVAEADGGVTLDWAAGAQGGALDTWTAHFTDTPAVRLTYTCGRLGEVDAAFTARPNGLDLRVQDGASGALLLTFERRA